MIHDVFSTGVECRFHQLVLVGTGRKHHLTAMFEQESDRAIRPQVTAILGERVADIGDGPSTIVRQAVDNDCRTIDAITLVADFLVVDGLLSAGTALDRALDGVLRHVIVHRLVDSKAQSRIARPIASAQLGGDRDFADEAAEYLAALGVGSRFAVLDVRPLAVAGHGQYTCELR